MDDGLEPGRSERVDLHFGRREKHCSVVRNGGFGWSPGQIAFFPRGGGGGVEGRGGRWSFCVCVCVFNGSFLTGLSLHSLLRSMTPVTSCLR